ncbi:MAG: lectin-like protein, partial [Roseibacillus sp.]
KDLKVLQIALEKKLATMVAQAPVAPLLTPTEGDSEAPAPVAVPQVQVAIGPNWSLLRNLIIIVLLIGAIYGMNRAYKWQKQNIADQKIEQEKKDQKEKMELIAEQLRVKKERDRIAALKPPDIDPANLPVEPKVETPLDALARLKKSLLVLDKESRDSQEFPPTTHVRGSSRFFFVETPLSWQRAAAYAEDHGGHLATCINEGEQNWLSSKTPKKTTVWLGGGATGRTAWGWVDGTKWSVRKPSTSTGNSATLSDLGSIRAKPGGLKYPFFIQWRMDGSNPGSLAAQLERLKKSLETPDPIFPPGVLSFESRRYLIIEKQVSWEDAAIIAQGAHGHLAVPSAQTEGEYLMAAVSSTLPAGAGAWLGGQHNGRSWTWATGEPWAFASWAPDSPDGNEAVDTAVRLVAGDDGGWDDANPSDTEAAAAFVIEWSKDRSSTTTAATTAGGGDWSALRAESLKKVQILEGKYATALAENGKGLKWDLNFWHRGLRDNDERTYAPAVARVKAKVQPDGTITIAQNEIIKLPPRGVQVVKKHLTEQQQLEATLVSQANKIRIKYLAGLGEKKSTAQNSGLNSQIRAIDNEIEACGKSGKTFLEHFGSGY